MRWSMLTTTCQLFERAGSRLRPVRGHSVVHDVGGAGFGAPELITKYGEETMSTVGIATPVAADDQLERIRSIKTAAALRGRKVTREAEILELLAELSPNELWNYYPREYDEDVHTVSVWQLWKNSRLMMELCRPISGQKFEMDILSTRSVQIGLCLLLGAIERSLRLIWKEFPYFAQQTAAFAYIDMYLWAKRIAWANDRSELIEPLEAVLG
jgi:hypothetical protein